nr:immunoglobulin heavy chain junction region [Mus musculus]
CARGGYYGNLYFAMDYW